MQSGSCRAQRAVQRELLALVERRGRLVEEHHLGFGQQHPRERDALLLAGGEHLGPVGHLVEAAAKMPERHRVERGLGLPSSSNSPAAAGYETTARRSPSGMYGICDRNMVPSAGLRTVPDVNGQSCARLRNRVVFPQPEPPVITNDSPESSRTSSGSTSRMPCGRTDLHVVELKRAVAAGQRGQRR